MLEREARERRDEESRYEIFDETKRHVERRRRRRFDRIAFAMRILDIIKPPEKVVIYRRRDEFTVERGTHIRGGRVRRYSILGIPLGASRHQIAYELATLTGLEVLPHAVTALVKLAESPGRAG